MGYKYRYWWKNRFLLGLLVSILLHGGLILLLGLGAQDENPVISMSENPLQIHFIDREEGSGTTDRTDLPDGEEGSRTTDQTDLSDDEEGSDPTDQTDLSDGVEGNRTTDLTDNTVGEEESETRNRRDNNDVEEGSETLDQTDLSDSEERSGTTDNSEDIFAALSEGLVLQKPGYPEVARRWGYEGIVRVEILVAADGSVDEVHLLESSGYEILDQSVMRTVSRKWAFLPPGRHVSVIRSFEFYLE